MFDFRPLVSIVIPVYNGENYLREAIESALAQTYNNYEIIVVNDGSTDGTEKIALSFGDRIRYFKKENGGQSSALNYGIENMNGEYFSWLSHDDVYFREKIEVQISALSKLTNKDKTILYSDYELIDSMSRKIRDVRIPEFDPALFRYKMMITSPVNGCTVLIPGKAFSSIGLFKISRPHTSDCELFFNMASVYSFIHIPEILIQSRTHKQQMTIQKASYHNSESNLFLLYGLKNLTRDELVATGEKYPNIYLKIAENWAGRGYIKASLSALKAYQNSEKNYMALLMASLNCMFLYINKRITKTGSRLINLFTR
jgi:glycosyltransferase involved in cell wall biosynthesis